MQLSHRLRVILTTKAPKNIPQLFHSRWEYRCSGTIFVYWKSERNLEERIGNPSGPRPWYITERTWELKLLILFEKWKYHVPSFYEFPRWKSYQNANTYMNGPSWSRSNSSNKLCKPKTDISFKGLAPNLKKQGKRESSSTIIRKLATTLFRIPAS